MAQVEQAFKNSLSLITVLPPSADMILCGCAYLPKYFLIFSLRGRNLRHVYK